MILLQRKGLYVLIIICAVFQIPTVCGQRAIFSLGKRLQQQFSGHPQHVPDPPGENDSATKWHLAAAATTFLLVVLGYSSQKRVAAGGEFAFVPPLLLCYRDVPHQLRHVVPLLKL
jgi:hypothetical protein